MTRRLLVQCSERLAGLRWFLIRAVFGRDRSGLLLVEALFLIVHERMHTATHCHGTLTWKWFLCGVDWNWIANWHLSANVRRV